MRVYLYAMLRHIAGSPSVDVPVNMEMTIQDVFTHLIDLTPELKKRLYEEDGSLSPHIIVLINGRNILLENGLETPVNSEDEIKIMAQIAGG